MKIHSEQITAGLLIRGQVRGALDALKMYGNIEDYREAKGILDSVFYVKGADEVAIRTFRDWSRRAASKDDRSGT